MSDRPPLTWDHPVFWPARCPKCGWTGMSNETEGGHPIADTGDYTDPACPECCHTPEGRFMGDWIAVEELPPPDESQPSKETPK